jgi:hypothetical protein
VGVASPSVKLDVSGEIKSSGNITSTTGKLAVTGSGQTVGMQIDGFVAGASLDNYILNNSGNAGTTASLNFGRTTSLLYGFLRINNNTQILELGTAATARLSIDQTGNVGVGVVPAGTGGCLQLKSGITFPATQVAASDANTLDDYEESTWSPTITAGTGTPTTVTVNAANYTKIGRVVVVNIDFSVVAIGTASGFLNFTLPFNHSGSSLPCGAFRENASTGNIGQIFYGSGTTASCMMYNNATTWVNGYRIQGTYTYFSA